MRNPLSLTLHGLTTAVCASLFALPTTAQIDEEMAAAIRQAGLEESQVMDILDELTNGIGHRLTGSDNFTRACEWAADEFREMGLSNVQLEKWDTWPIVWNRGQWMGRVLGPEPMELQVATEAYVNGTRGRQRGPAIRTPRSQEELAEVSDQLDGAWLVGPLPSPRGEFFADLLEQTYGRILGFAYGSTASGRRGAPADYPNRMRVFSSATMRGRVPTFDTPPEESTRIMVRRDQMDRILEMVDAGQSVELEFDVRNRWRAEPIDLHNVIAEIPGTEKPDEVVVICGHLDSWHQASGTTDNGTGTASTMETARILMAVGAQPKRTIRFCLWGGEEQGLLGSAKHTTIRRQELDKISAVYNHDTGTNWAAGLTVTPGMREMLEPVFAPIMELTPPDVDHEGPVFRFRETESFGGRGGGSDHASFLGKGVPGLSWSLTGRSDYFGYTWHTQWDTYDVAIPEYMRHNATVFAMAALGTANLPEMLPREGIGRARGSDAKPVIERILGMELGGEGNLDVTSVADGGTAARWGLKAGDRLHSVGETRIDSLGRLRLGLRAIQQADEGSRSGTLTVRREEELVVLKISF
ncbi:MAG: M20/M25/M40 family metallo-hydrolase [Planctomycetota bacterium]